MQDMTKGRPLGLILWFTLPLLISNLFQQLYSISDVILVGRFIGVNALAAVGAGMPLFFFLVMISIGFTNGLTVIVAQSFGAKDWVRLRRSVFTSLVLGAGFTLFFGLGTLIILDPLLHLMQVPDEIFVGTKAFLQVICLGVIFIVGFNLMSAFMRALGDSKTPLYFLIFTTLVNIVLNIVYIRFLKLGVMGSALGTCTAMFISVVLCVLYMLKAFPMLWPRRADCRLDFDFCLQHIRIALPMAVQFSIISLAVAITQAACNQLGPDTIAGMTAAMRIEQLASQPMVSLGIAMATYVAQNYGAHKIVRIRRGVKRASLISVLMSVVLGGFLYLTNPLFLRLFMGDQAPRLLPIVETYLTLAIGFYFFLGQIFVFRNACQGMGNSWIAMVSSVIELLARFLCIHFLVGPLGFAGICWSNPFAWVGAAVVVSVGYYGTLRRARRAFRIERRRRQHAWA